MLHYSFATESRLTKFTDVTFSKFYGTREAWLQYSGKEQNTVAVNSLQYTMKVRSTTESKKAFLSQKMLPKVY